MSEISRGLDISAEHEIVGPDYFGFYAFEVAELLRRDEDFLPFSSQAPDPEIKHGILKGKSIGKDANKSKENNDTSGGAPLFSNSLETWVSDLRKERLKSLLRQSVVALSQEVDEMLDPIFSMSRIQAILRYKKSLPTSTSTACDTDNGQPPQKKIKVSTSFSDSETKQMDITVPGKEMLNGVVTKCYMCSATEFSESLCNGCSIRLEQQRSSELVNSDFGAEKENGEGNDDLQFLLESESSEVEETIKKHSDELLITIKHMENMLDNILDIVTSNCRLMSLIEKQELKILIQNLPARNLDRVAEIIQCSRPEGKDPCGEIHVDLESEENATLWRLYYYAQTVESARKRRKAQ